MGNTVELDLMDIKQASVWASRYLGKNVTTSTELRISNGKIWRLGFEPDARRDDEGVVDALRRGGATLQQAKDRPAKFSLLMRSSVTSPKIAERKHYENLSTRFGKILCSYC